MFDPLVLSFRILSFCPDSKLKSNDVLMRNLQGNKMRTKLSNNIRSLNGSFIQNRLKAYFRSSVIAVFKIFKVLILHGIYIKDLTMKMQEGEV